MNRYKRPPGIEVAPTVFPLYMSGYLTLGERPSDQAYNPQTDVVVRAFETCYGAIVTTEDLQHGLEVFETGSHQIGTFIECRIMALMACGFVSNKGKVFAGRFRREDRVRGIKVVWESKFVKADREAQERYDRDISDPEIDYLSLDFEQYRHESLDPFSGLGVPVSVIHLETLEIRTSPEILDPRLGLVMQRILDEVAEQQQY